MIRRKTRQQLRRVFVLTSAVLVLNLTFPTHAAVAAPAETLPVTSNAVVEQTPIVSAVAAGIPGLPDVPDKPARLVINVRASAYSSTVDQCDGDPFTTASGAKVRPGTVAANWLPFGTQFRIPEYFGNQVFTVQDRMNAKWGGRRVDLWMNSRQEAKQWGVRSITIEVL